MRLRKYNPNKMENVSIFASSGVKYDGEFTKLRIDKSTIPDNKYVYECRLGDGSDVPLTVEDRVKFDFGGTFITETPVIFPNPKDRYVDIIGFIKLVNGD